MLSIEVAEQFDIVIVGGGLAGCAFAHQVADGARKILILEARPSKNPRFNGELIHPTGVDVLRKMGVMPALYARGGVDVRGFACSEDPSLPIQLLPYDEIPGSTAGFAIDHHDLVEVLRKSAEALPGVTLRFGERVVDLCRDEERVSGVVTTKGAIAAKLVVACDGRHSKMRTLVGIHERATLLSFTAAARLADCKSPAPGYGHIFLGGPAPILVYPISAKDSRTCVDLPILEGEERGKDAVIERLRRDYLPFFPEGTRQPMADALAAGEIEMAANYSIRTDECTVPGLALVGDACGCSHPITATGMTVGLHDVEVLGKKLRGVPLSNRAAVDNALADYQHERYQFVRAREILADAIYEVFRGVDDGARAIRAGIFRYWRAALSHRASSMSLLSGRESRLPTFLREYLTVVSMSTSTVLRGAVNTPTLRGRVRSLFGLTQKSLEKLRLVARNVADGQMAV